MHCIYLSSQHNAMLVMHAIAGIDCMMDPRYLEFAKYVNRRPYLEQLHIEVAQGVPTCSLYYTLSSVLISTSHAQFPLLRSIERRLPSAMAGQEKQPAADNAASDVATTTILPRQSQFPSPCKALVTDRNPSKMEPHTPLQRHHPRNLLSLRSRPLGRHELPRCRRRPTSLPR